MTHDKAERKHCRSWGRFDHKGKGKRAASKWRRQAAKKETQRHG